MGTTAKTNNSESESTAIFLIKDFISSCLSEYSALGRCIAVRVAIMPAFVNLESGGYCASWEAGTSVQASLLVVPNLR